MGKGRKEEGGRGGEEGRIGKGEGGKESRVVPHPKLNPGCATGVKHNENHTLNKLS